MQAKETARFRENPFNYGRQVFKPKNITKPDFDAEQATKYFSTVYSDLKRDFTYHQPQNLDDPPPTSFTTSTRPPSFADFSAVLRSRRNSSAPGPNGIPNVIWKRCPSLQKRLYSVILRVWNTCQIPPSWQHAAIRLIHKSGSASDPANFRPIALTNCDGKIFFCTSCKFYPKAYDKKLFL